MDNECRGVGEICVPSFRGCWARNVYSTARGTCHAFPVSPMGCTTSDQCAADQVCISAQCVDVEDKQLDCAGMGHNCRRYGPPHSAIGCICDQCPDQVCDTQLATVMCSNDTTCAETSSVPCPGSSTTTSPRNEAQVMLTCQAYVPDCQNGVCQDPNARSCTRNEECDVDARCESVGGPGKKCNRFSTRYPPNLNVCPTDCKALPIPHSPRVLCDCQFCPSTTDGGVAVDAGPAVDAGAPDAGHLDGGVVTVDGGAGVYPQGAACTPLTSSTTCPTGVCQQQYTLCGGSPQGLLTYACVPAEGGPCTTDANCANGYSCPTNSSTCKAVDCSATKGQCGVNAALAYPHACNCQTVICTSTDPTDPIDPGPGTQ